MSSANSDVPRRGNRFATASLMWGLLSFIPYLCLPAFGFGILGLAKSMKPGVSGRRRSIAGVILGVVGMFWTVAILLPSPNGPRPNSPRVQCANNLKQIDLALSLYLKENQGSYPPNLGVLMKAEELNADVATCPSTSNHVPANLAADGIYAWVNTSSNYIFNAAGRKSAEIEDDYVTVYEKDDDHGGDGMNLLFADGHVEFETLPQAHAAIAKSVPHQATPAASH